MDNALIDWNRMLAPGVLEKLAPPMQVAEISNGTLLDLQPDVYADQMGKLAQHASLAWIAQPVINDDPSCGHVEGYEDPRILAASIERLKQVKAPIRYLALDGGLFNGHYLTGPQACRLSLDQTVKQVAIAINAFKTLYPDIIVGEIMPTVPLTTQPDWQEKVRAYRDGLRQATGKTLEFFTLDIAWQNPGWKQAVAAETALVRSLGARIGYIYNGDGYDASDAAWIAHAKRNVAEIEGGLGLHPDLVSFGRWNPHPVHLVGAPGDETLASLMLWYAQPGTRLKLTPKGAEVSGVVEDHGGRPLAGMRVVLDAASSGAAPAALPRLTASGTVPADARTALLALRINKDCNCVGPDDVVLGEVTYQEAGGPPVSADFAAQMRRIAAKPGPSDPSVVIDPAPGGDVARIVVASDKWLGLNSRMFPVAPGAMFKLTAPALNRLDTDMFGGVLVIWFDAKGNGIGSERLAIKADLQPAASAVTDDQGRFTLARPLGPDGRPRPARVTVPDQKDHRAAIAAVGP